MMTTTTSIVVVAACISLAGCMSLSTSTERTESGMKALMLQEFRFGQTEPVDVLMFLDVAARRAHSAFTLEYAEVREARHAAEVDWLANRKPDGTMPQVRSPWYTGWVPASPNPGFALTVTVAQNGTNAISFHEALSILCSVSGLKWHVEESKVIVTPDKK